LAANIPEDKIREVRNAADIYEVVSESVALKKTGKNFQGLCPFHTEKTPSFSVNPSKQIFYCFGCGVGGDAIEFLMKKEGMSFPEAVRDLARRAGIHIPTGPVSPEQKRRMTEREQLLKINRLAKDFYQNRLKGPNGKAARKYLETRRLQPEIIDAFQLGFAPDGWDHLAGFLGNRRVPSALSEKLGLIAPRRSGNGHYDKFRNRIVFPIFNASRQVVGFGGRVMDDSLPKYLNSPETPVYSKGRSLYGVDLAKQAARENERVYIVEGYLDLISMVQHGIRNTVATLGTALTGEHVRILRGLVGAKGRVVLVFDSDTAGIKAAERSIDVFAKEYMDAYILVLEEGHDPDSYLFEYGAKRFEKASQSALSTVSFLIESAVKRHGLSPEGKIRIMSDVQKPLAEIEDPVAKSLYVKSVCERIGVDENAVMEKVLEVERPTKGQRDGGRKAVREGGMAAGTAGDLRNLSLEARMESRIVSMMLQVPSMIQEVRARGLVELFENRTLQLICRTILEKPPGSNATHGEMFENIESDELKAFVASLAIGDESWEEGGCMKLISQFETTRARRQRSLLQDIKAAEASNDPDALDRLLKEKMEQARQKLSLKKRRDINNKVVSQRGY
jgi:DNA primase